MPITEERLRILMANNEERVNAGVKLVAESIEAGLTNSTQNPKRPIIHVKEWDG